MPTPENLTPLTDAQRELVAANVRLAWWAVDALPRLARALGRREALSLACLALCRAARTYDPARSKFSTYALLCVRQQLAHAVEAASRPVRNCGRPPLPLEEARAVGVRDPEPVESRPWLSRAVAALPPRDRRIVRLWAGLDGEPLTDREIGERLGADRTTVQHWRRRAIERLREMAPASAVAAEGGGA